MKIQSSKLSKALSSLGQICGRRTTLPILSCVEITVANGFATLRASDCATEAEEAVECEGVMHSICVTFGILRDFAASVDGEIEFTLGKRLKCKCGSAVIEIAVSDPKEFPPRRTEKFTGVGVNCADLSDAIDATAWAAASPGSSLDRPVMEAVHLRGYGDGVYAEAATGGLFARASKLSISAIFGSLIPAPQALQLAEFMRREESSFLVSEKSARVTAVGCSITTSLVNGTYPDVYSGLLSAKRVMLGALDGDALLRALQVATSGCDKIFHRIMLGFGESGLLVESVHERNNYDTVIEGKFAPFEIALSAFPLMTLLKSIKDRKVLKVSNDDSDKPKLFLESGDLLTCIGGLAK